MQEGLLWFDADPKRDLAEKITRAADRYRYKFGQRPNVCYVNPITLNGGSAKLAEYNGVRLVPSPNVLKNHFWIGVGETKELRKAA
jgi:hypothetical protein